MSIYSTPPRQQHNQETPMFCINVKIVLPTEVRNLAAALAVWILQDAEDRKAMRDL